MPRNELERQIIKRTGDDLHEIRRLGFQVTDLTDPDFDPPPAYRPQVVDWDELEQSRWF
jgi:hypothetical protein